MISCLCVGEWVDVCMCVQENGKRRTGMRREDREHVKIYINIIAAGALCDMRSIQLHLQSRNM